jgi:hypothetical protein
VQKFSTLLNLLCERGVNNGVKKGVKN